MNGVPTVGHREDLRWMAAVLLCTLLLFPAGGGADVAVKRDFSHAEVVVYVIPLRVHAGRSGRSHDDLKGVVTEVNRIWRTQAGICFEGEIVDHDEPLTAGMDVWFLPAIKRYNGYFSGPNAIRVRDFPNLGPVRSPSADAAARTAAHELGHGLGLAHRQDSEENLMRSKTFGWKLHVAEVATARRAAAMASGSSGSRRCLSAAGE